MKNMKQNLDRFKFRWFNEKAKLMAEVLTLEGNTANVKYKDGQNGRVSLVYGILMQCTGLKDRNGNLIYEGDVFKEEYIFSTEDNNKNCVKIGERKDEKGYIHSVYRDEIQYRYYLVKNENFFIYGECIRYDISKEWQKQILGKTDKFEYLKSKRHFTLPVNLIYDSEIIGNIYENPELIKN